MHAQAECLPKAEKEKGKLSFLFSAMITLEKIILKRPFQGSGN
jgi:hypothetical protein